MDEVDYIKRNFDAFLLGSVGFEMFSYHKLLKLFQSSSLEQLGSQLKFVHHKDFLLTLIEYSKGNVEYMVYTIGFLINYATDITTRPYIHSKTEKPEGGGDVIKQTQFEQALDAYLYREQEQKSTVVRGGFLQNIKQKKIRYVSGLLSSVCRKVAPQTRVWKKDIVAAYDHTKAFTKRINEDKEEAMDKMKAYENIIGKKGRLSIFVPPNIISGNDIFNLAHRTWRAPWQMQVSRNESVLDLLNKSIDVAINIINQVTEYYLSECSIDDVEKVVGNINFNGREIQ